LDQSKTVVFILDIDLTSLCFSRSLSQISNNKMSTEECQKRGSAQDPSGKIMAPWTFHVKFPYDTQFTFGSLTFATGKDWNLKMLPTGSALERLASVYGQVPYFLAISSTTCGACSGLDSYTGLHIRTVKLVRGIDAYPPVVGYGIELIFINSVSRIRFS
jgi:hypothetical protein